MDMVVTLQGMDGIVRKLDSDSKQFSDGFGERVGCGKVWAYVKPLIRVNSCLMVPPCDLALSLALDGEDERHEKENGGHWKEILFDLVGRSTRLQRDLSSVRVRK